MMTIRAVPAYRYTGSDGMKGDGTGVEQSAFSTSRIHIKRVKDLQQQDGQCNVPECSLFATLYTTTDNGS